MRSKPNAYRNGNCDANTDSNASAEAYSDAKACADPAPAADSVALSESVKAGTREAIREFLQRAIGLLSQLSHAALWSAAVSRRFSS